MSKTDRVTGHGVDVSMRIHRDLGPRVLGGATAKEGLLRLGNDHKPCASPHLCANEINGE